MPDIVLATINARYAHASLGLRCLMANLGALEPRARIVEFVVGARTEDVVERILAQRPRVVGFGVYVWNVAESTRVVAQLRRVAPGVAIVVGGPEVSHEVGEQAICALAHHVVTGPGETAFARLAAQLLDGPRPLAKVVAGDAPPPGELALPYRLYTDTDLRERNVYVEASRGCPFKCEFCLSALDRTAVPFDTDALLAALADLHARGARTFRFVDRTFNLRVPTSLAILEFFLERLERAPDDPVFAHFELVPDHLPARLRDAIRHFPPGTLQLEIGIQTWNPDVQALISRRQDDALAAENLAWLREHSNAHLHVDLIAGLPGEDLASFARGFDRLVALAPHEIQVGILKRLRGAPIARHTEAFGMTWNPDPPYNVLATDRIAFADMQRVGRFARYWDLYANSGRFPRGLALVIEGAPFERFMAFSDWLWARADATHRLSMERQSELLRQWLLDDAAARHALPARATQGAVTHAAPARVTQGAGTQGATAAAALDSRVARVERALADDWAASGARGRPAFLARGTRAVGDAAPAAQRRQSRHHG